MLKLKDDILQILLKVFRSYRTIERVIVFSMFSNNSEKIHIAIVGKLLTQVKFQKIKQNVIAHKLPVKFKILLYHRIKNQLVFERILLAGKVIYRNVNK